MIFKICAKHTTNILKFVQNYATTFLKFVHFDYQYSYDILKYMR